MIEWVNESANKEFSSGPVMGLDGLAWISKSRTWLRKFCKQIGATNLEFHKGHYEWFAFFLYKDQWWYCSSGDVRFKLMKSMLIRRTQNNRDFMGERNQFVPYDNAFEGNLIKILFQGV